MYRFIGQLYHNDMLIVEHIAVASDDVPHSLEILLVIVTNLEVLRTYTWGTHDYIHAVVECLLSYRPIDRLHVLLQTALAESRDVGLSCFRTSRGLVGIICPTWVEVETEEVAVCPLFRVSDGSEDLLKIVETCWHCCIIAVISPAEAVEVRTRSVHHSVQHHFVSVRVFKLISLHMEWLHNAKLCECREWHGQSYCHCFNKLLHL